MNAVDINARLGTQKSERIDRAGHRGRDGLLSELREYEVLPV